MYAFFFILKKKKICDNAEAELEARCVEFPRFYFISKQLLIETLSHTRDCRKYLDTVKLCFKGVKDLIYTLPPHLLQSTGSLDSKNLKQLNFDINCKR